MIRRATPQPLRLRGFSQSNLKHMMLKPDNFFHLMASEIASNDLLHITVVGIVVEILTKGINVFHRAICRKIPKAGIASIFDHYY